MADFLTKLADMSVAASFLVPVVLLLRLALKKAPKWVAVLLWGLVAVRLLCPFTLESEWSLVPGADTVRQEFLAGDSGVQVDASPMPVQPGVILPGTPIGTETDEAAFPWETVVAAVWLAGVTGMLLYTGISYWMLRRKVATAVRMQPGVYQSEHVASPFVLGIFRPRIYLPFAMDSASMAHVITHEQAHLRRRDHWWKPLGFLLLSLHWFNPVLWVGYIFLCRDIELACDEKVIAKMDSEAKADYTQALVACSVGRRRIAACPLAFGEVGVKERIKRVMHYKKPAFWIVLVAVVLCIVVAVCFLTNRPAQEEEKPEAPWQVSGKTYLYEKEGCMGGFYITVNTDGTFYYYEGPLSSHIGLGNWTQENDILVLTESAIGLENRFRIEDGKLVFLEEESTNFIYLKVKDGERFLFSGEATQNNGLVARSGSTCVPVLTVPAGNPITEYADSVHWLTIDPGEEVVPFTLLDYGVEVRGSCRAYDAETGQALSSFLPSGLDPQTYLFSKADPARQYIVLVQLSQDADAALYAFGARFPQSQGGVDGPENITVTRKMTLYDVRQFSRMGMDPVWESFAGFTGREVGSGLYIMCYDIDGDFYVLVGGAEMTGKPMYARLCCSYTDAYVDIRGGDIEAFIAQYQRGEQSANSLGGAISAAILEKNAGDSFRESPSGKIHTHSYYILGTEQVSGTPVEGQTNHMEQTTVYLLYAYYCYGYTGGSLESLGAVSAPALLTFHGNEETGYTLEAFWQPETGESYEQQIRSRFPEAVAKGILAPVNDYYAADLHSKCLTQAEGYLAEINGQDRKPVAWVWEQESVGNSHFRFSFSVPYTRMEVTCSQGKLADMDSSTIIKIAQMLDMDAKHGIYWSPALEEGFLQDANIYFTLYDGEAVVYSGVINLTGREENGGAVYLARLQSSGLYMQSNPQSVGAIIAPIAE